VQVKRFGWPDFLLNSFATPRPTNIRAKAMTPVQANSESLGPVTPQAVKVNQEECQRRETLLPINNKAQPFLLTKDS